MNANERPARGSRIGRVLAVAGTVLALAACAGAPPSMPPPAPLLPPPAPPPMTPPPAPMAEIPQAPPMMTMMMMMMPTDAASLRAAYGSPDFVRRERDSELWRYDAGSCAVFFFLYRDGGSLAIRYVETEPRGMTMPADPQCLASLNGRARPTS